MPESTTNAAVIAAVDGKLQTLDSEIGRLDELTGRRSSLAESIGSLKAQEAEHLRNEQIPEDEAVQKLIEVRSRADVQSTRLNSLNDQIREQQAKVVSVGDDASNSVNNLFSQLRAHRSAQVLRVFDQHFELPLGARVSRTELAESSKPVRAIANLLPSAQFGNHHRPAEQRIAAFRGFAKTFLPLREVLETEVGLALNPIGGAPALAVVERAA